MSNMTLEPEHMVRYQNAVKPEEKIFKDKDGLEWVTRICRTCKLSYQAIYHKGHAITTGRCIPCGERWIKQNGSNLNATLEARTQQWRSICPPKYLDNDTSKIDSGCFNKVLEYTPSWRGLLCYGASMKGKTTSCWRLLEKLWIFQGIKPVAMTEPEFSQLASKHYRLRDVDYWLDELCQAQVLFLDDLGHSATTAKHLEELYFVVENRTSHKRPIIATTQFNAEEMTDRAEKVGGSKTVVAILNRLKASCEPIIFK